MIRECYSVEQLFACIWIAKIFYCRFKELYIGLWYYWSVFEMCHQFSKHCMVQSPNISTCGSDFIPCGLICNVPLKPFFKNCLACTGNSELIWNEIVIMQHDLPEVQEAASSPVLCDYVTRKWDAIRADELGWWRLLVWLTASASQHI